MKLIRLSLLAAILSVVTGCSAFKNIEVNDVLDTANKVAQGLCVIYYTDKLEIDAAEALESYCANEADYAAWLDEALLSSQAGAQAKAAASKKESE